MKAPIRDSLSDKKLSVAWTRWFSSVDNYMRSVAGSGTTSNRPTKELFVGMDYFDSELGVKITIKSLNPTVWVNSSGENIDTITNTASTTTSTTTETAAPYRFASLSYTQAQYTNMPTGRISCNIANLQSLVLIDGMTQMRALFSSSATGVAAGVYFGFSYDTVTSAANNSAATTELTSEGWSMLYDSTTQYGNDTGWLDLAGGLQGAIFPSVWADGATGGTKDMAFSVLTFYFR